MYGLRKTAWLGGLATLGAIAGSCQANVNSSETPQPEAAGVDATPLTTSDVPPSQPTVSRLTSDDKNCEASEQWLKKPSFPDGGAFDPNSNCSFHQWAYQTFLWLVSKNPESPSGALIFEGLANPKSLFVPGGPTAPYPGSSSTQNLELLPRQKKSQVSADIEDIFQAGPGNQVLIDQAGNIVYYANHLNQQFWDFVVQDRLYDLTTLQKVQPGNGAPGAPNPEFPVDALELKSSWRVASYQGQTPLIPDAEQRFIVVNTQVPEVKPDKNGIWRKTGATRNAQMALVGLHVTGIVKAHHEFIWATFEHEDNAPNCSDIPSSKQKSGPGGPWNFYDGKAPSSACNQYDSANPGSIVNVCLMHPNGGGVKANINAIETLNANVKKLEDKAAITQHYRLGGAVWTTGTIPKEDPKTFSIPLNDGAFDPNASDLGATQLGSLDLANTSMETFTQNQNCFACHNGGSHTIDVGGKTARVNAKDINLSHFIVNYQARETVTQPVRKGTSK